MCRLHEVPDWHFMVNRFCWTLAASFACSARSSIDGPLRRLPPNAIPPRDLSSSPPRVSVFTNKHRVPFGHTVGRTKRIAFFESRPWSVDVLATPVARLAFAMREMWLRFPLQVVSATFVVAEFLNAVAAIDVGLSAIGAGARDVFTKARFCVAPGGTVGFSFPVALHAWFEFLAAHRTPYFGNCFWHTLMLSAVPCSVNGGAEMDPETFAKAVGRIKRGYTPAMVLPVTGPKLKQESLL